MDPRTPTELAYFAGIIDGEGCISLSTGRAIRNNRYGTCLFIGNTDEHLIHWVHAKFGGTVGLRKRQKPNQKDLWWVNFTGSALESVLSAAIPYLVLKREQAELMLEFRKTVNEIGHNAITPDTVLDRRAAMKDRMSVLNYRGIRG